MLLEWRKKRRPMEKVALAGGLVVSKLQMKVVGHEEEYSHQNAAAWHP